MHVDFQPRSAQYLSADWPRAERHDECGPKRIEQAQALGRIDVTRAEQVCGPAEIIGDRPKERSAFEFIL